MAEITKDILLGVKTNLLVEIDRANASIEEAKSTIERARACLGLLDQQIQHLDAPAPVEEGQDEDVSSSEQG